MAWLLGLRAGGINEGIFEYGARIDYEIQYIQPNLTLEIGRFNNSQAYSTNLGFDIFYPISKLELNIAVGIGIEYNGFVKRNFYPGGRKDEFTHRMPSTINVNIKLFNTILILVEQIFDQDIFWKARFGINILNFIKK